MEPVSNRKICVNLWKEMTIDALVVAGIYRKEHENNPHKALVDLLAWETAVALDPKVSKEARDLLYQTPPVGKPLSESDLDFSLWK